MSVPRLLDVELWADVKATVGEGPQWDAGAEQLVWVDIPAGAVHTASASGTPLKTYELGRSVGAALLTRGGFLVADEDGFEVLQSDGTITLLLPLLSDAPRMRFNDGKCDPAGRAWAGSMAKDKSPGCGSLYRLDPGPTATPVLKGLTISNGLGWSPDGSTMWFADSALPLIRGFRYDVKTGELGGLRATIGLRDTQGVPDGLCVDDDGGVWVALWDGGAVHRYTPDGRLDTVVRVPARRVTSCAFGGAGLRILFITTARSGLTPTELREQPRAGGIFAVHPGISGPAGTPWRQLSVGAGQPSHHPQPGGM